MKTFIACALLIAALNSCKQSEDKTNFESGQSKAMEAVLMPSPPSDRLKFAPPRMVTEAEGNAAFASVDPANQSVISADTSRKIIKSGELSFETDDVVATRKKIIARTLLLKGYLAEESESGFENERKNYILNLKVPAKSFEHLLEYISSDARQIDSKNIRVDDITSEYIDTRTRLHNKKQLEKRYLQLLTKASRITDMLAIENKLSEIRSEIESVEGQFIYMKRQVAYSSLSITFYSKAIVQETGKGFLYMVVSSFANGWEFLQQLFFKILAFWPLIIILVVVGGFYRRWKRRVSGIRRGKENEKLK